MAYKNPVVNVGIPADLLTVVRSLPLEQTSTTKKIIYLVKLGVRYHGILEKAAAEADKTDS
jgi:hypothetical protein